MARTPTPVKSFVFLTFFAMLFSFVTVPVRAQISPEIRKAVYFDKTPPLRDMKLIEPGPHERSWKNGEVRNEGSERERNDNPLPLPVGMDPVIQQEFGFRSTPGIVSNFEGVGNRNSVYPPDTDGDVSADYYFQMINCSFEIYDKEGNSLYGPADNRTLWNGFIGPWTGTNDGDPILIYDELADRWVATQFAIHTSDGTYWELIALSESGDPLGAYYRYAFQFPVFNDYPKLGVWPDGYYFSFNMFGDDYRRAAVCALERDAMLVGDTNARMILFDMPDDSEPWSLLPADIDGAPPPEGAPDYFAYLIDDAYGEGDILSIWALNADWDNPENSTFEEVNRLNTAPFNSHFCNASLGACLHQPDGGPNLEALSDRLMYRLQYRNFGDYQAMVTNHTVNADGDGLAGIRWYELRYLNDGNGWFIYQQGTYAPDGHNRWMGSVAMDGRGYIALGFSIVSPTKYPSIRYTGRSPNDPLGQMTFYEEEIMAGTGVQTGSVGRWGDYSMMSVDPADDTTFWFTTEYVKQSGQVSWQTRIAGFRMVEDNVAPEKVTDLEATANTTNSVTLTWTATGDDGSSGTAFLYDIRYSTEPIVEGSFETAQQAEKTPAPAEAGSPETFTVKGLDFNTTYYIAMKVRDRQYNFSELSNVVQATTPGAPVVTVVEPAVVQKIFPGSSGTRLYSIQNTGASDLYFKVQKVPATQVEPNRRLGDYADHKRVSNPDEVEMVLTGMANQSGAGNRETGDILGIYQNAAIAISGITWAGDNLFMTDMQNSLLLRYDTAQQMIIDTVQIHNTPFSIAWDGEFLWIGDKTGNVFAYGMDGTPAGFSFSCPETGFCTLTWDGSAFLTNYILDKNPVIWRVDAAGHVLSSFKAWVNTMNIWQLVYVPEHYGSHLWFTNNSGKIYQMQIDEDNNAVILQNFTAPSSSSYALAHDHYDLWYGRTGGVLYRIDDGIKEVNWLQVNPGEGIIPAAGNDDISLGFDAGKFDYGSRFADMKILTNDPQEPEVVVPVEMRISDISLGSDTSFCSNLSILLDAGGGFASYLWSDGSTGQTNLVGSGSYGNGLADIWVDVTDIGGAVKRDSILINFIDCASIFEFSSGLNVTVFPNPNQGRFTVQAEGMKGHIRLTVTDLGGKVILQHEMASPGKEEIDLSSDPKGQYLLRIDSGEGIRVERIIIN